MASKRHLNSSIGEQAFTLTALISLSVMESSAEVCSPPPCHTETCWYVTLFRNSELIISRRWRRTRRAAHEILTKVVVRDYHPVFRKEAILLASAILDNPAALDKHIQRSSASATMSILYDYPTLENEHDETITRIHAFIDRVSAASAPGAHLVELFPWMIYVPERYASTSPTVSYIHLELRDIRFAKWKREGMEHFRQHTAMFNGLLNTVCSDIVKSIIYAHAKNFVESPPFQAKGSERPCVSASLIKNSKRSGLSNNEIAWLLGTL
jgi:hypothetical protein